MERFIVAVSTAMIVFALGYTASAVFGSEAPQPTPVVQRTLDAKALLKKLETLDTRLREAQTSIDQVLAKLATANDDITRTRLNVLYRLESGLTADIARTKQQLASVNGR